MSAVALHDHSDHLSAFGVSRPPEIHVECPAFSGTLGLLFVCVRDKKVDLLDVPLAPVCEAYFRYVLADETTDLDSAGVALAALSYLVERKVWALVNKPDEDEPESDVFDEGLEPWVQEFTPAIESLYDLQSERDQLFFRTGDTATAVYELPFDTEDVTPNDLARAFERLLERAKPDLSEPPVHKTRRNLSDVVVEVMGLLPNELTPLEEIFTGEFTKADVVWWFLALLELIRLGQARVQLDGGNVLFARGAAV